MTSITKHGQHPLVVSRREAVTGIALASAGLTSAAKSSSQPFKSLAPAPFVFRQVDVFSPQPFRGNPLAVVIKADALSDEQMKLFSMWTNLSETTFLLRPTDPRADYRVRIFSLGEELPFAGHPTLGSCHAWLASGGKRKAVEIVQQCGIGLVHLRGTAGRLAFEAPPLHRSVPLDPVVLDRLRRGLGLAEGEIIASRALDGGLQQTALLIKSRQRLLELKPDWATLATDAVGLIAPWGTADGADHPQFEVRVFDSTLVRSEDPVTGSFNANAALWLIGAGMAPEHYVVSQGTVLGRFGRVYVDRDDNRTWIGGDIIDHVVGQVTF